MTAKKSRGANLENKRVFRLCIGLLCASAFTLCAFEWRTTEEIPSSIDDYGYPGQLPDEVVLISNIPEPPPPPKPPVQTVEITIVDEISNTEPALVIPDHPEPIVQDISYIEPAPEEVTEEPIYGRSEIMPEFPGGVEKLFEYLADNLRYPALARNAGIEGTVHLRFVVSSTGEITEVTVLRGLGGGCTEETLRVMEQMPRWNPGIQNGRPVSVWFVLPVKFSLKN